MAIVIDSANFRPADSFGLYRSKTSPFSPISKAAPAAPHEDPADVAARQAIEQGNSRVKTQFKQLEQAEPGRYQVIDAHQLSAWQNEWQARQPGWIEDTARILGGSVAQGAGAVVSGLGHAVTSLGNATTTPIINSIFGTSYGQANPLGAPAEWLDNLGEKTKEGMSFATREAIANSTPEGDLLDPSTWSLGKAPSVAGYSALVLDVFGQMTPVIAAAVVAGPAGGAIVGGLQGGGAAGKQAEAVIDQMAAEPGLLEKESAFYREQIAAGRSHEEALAATKAAASQAAFLLTAPISGLGGFATSKIIDPATLVLQGRSLVTRLLGRAGLSALEEGAQEAAESVAANVGVNVGAGTDIDVTEGTFGDFLLGALAGGGVGGVAGGIGEGAQALGGRNAQSAPAETPPGAGPFDPATEQVTNVDVMPQAQPAAPVAERPTGVLTRAREHGLQQAGQRLVVNDPPLPGMGAGPAHGQTVTVSPHQEGIDPSMVRVVLEDGSERVLGARLLQDEQGAPLVPDPQATNAPISISPSEPGLPQAGQRVIVSPPGMEPFNAQVEQFITGEDGAVEAIVVDDDGEVLQVPREALSSLNLSPEQIEAAERAENPPPPMPEMPAAGGRNRQLPNARGETSTIVFPDETLAQLYDLGAEREFNKRLDRVTGASALERIEVGHGDRAQVQALAQALGVWPERVVEIADDYRFRVQRAAKDAVAGGTMQMHGLNAAKLKSWQAERKTPTGELDIEAAPGVEEPAAAVAPAVAIDDGAWWSAMGPGARRAVLAAAGVKRSEKSGWDKFSKTIRDKLNAVRAEMESADTEDAARRQAMAGTPEEQVPAAREQQEIADKPSGTPQILPAPEADVDIAAEEAATSPQNDRPEPSQAQKEAGNYAMGHVRIGGLALSIENPAGSERKGTDKGGKAWSVTMKSHYGYIRGTVGKDKDHIDVFVRPGLKALAADSPVFVIDQVDPSGKLDEHKVMLGFKTEAQARAAYLENYTKGWTGLGAITGTNLRDFKEWLKAGKTSRPFGALPAPKAKPEAKPEHPGLIVKSLETGKERVIQPKDTVPPAERELGVNSNGHKVFEDANGVRSYVEKGIKISEPVAVVPGQAKVGADPFKRRADFKTREEASARKDYSGLIADLKRGVESWAAEGGNPLLDGKLALAERLQGLSDEDYAKVNAQLSRDHAPGVTLEPEKGLAIIDEVLGSAEAAAAEPAPAPFGKNKLFTADKVEAARARLRSKINQLNSGPDPEVLVDGMTIAGAYIEAGVRDFADYAARMTADFGDGIRPFLLSFWEAVRHYPGLDTQGMTPAAEAARIAADLSAQEPGADDPAETQPAVDSRSGDRMGSDAGSGDIRAQPGAARADRGDVADGEPENVAPAESGRRGRSAGTRGAAKNVAGAGQADLLGDGSDGRPGAGGARASDAGAGERAAGRGGSRTELTPVVKAPETVSPANQGPGNFHIEDPRAIVGGGQVARFEKNKRAIELANLLRDEGRKATLEEQQILAGYTGWGSFGQDLFQGTWANPRPKAGWEARDAWLRDNLGKTEWESLQRSITNAHYTDPPTVLAMWDMATRMGFAGGRVLEPSMGIGNFFGMMPKAIKARSALTGIELEQVTGEMARQLYPDANISIMGYQDSKTPDNFYDLVIGNWPFEDTVIADRRYNRLSPYLHDYFYLKAVDQVRPGGLVMGITSKGTLDKKDSGIRSALAKKAELVAAFRLPSGAFEDYAGTNVVTDIIILRKREEALGNSAGEGWIKSVPYKTPQGEEVSVNEYYLTHPDHVIGTIEYGHGTTFRRPGLIVTRPADVAGELRRVTGLVPEDAYKPEARAARQISYITNHTADREGALVKTDQGLFIVRGEHLAPAADVAKYEVKDAKATAERVAQLEHLIDMRKAYAALIAAERAADGKPEPARAALRKLYEDFTKAYGPLSQSYGLNYLSKIDDPFYPSLAALEQRSDQGYRPATILRESTVRAARKIDNPTVADAFVLARSQSINPTLDQIAAIAKRPADAVRAELVGNGAVFQLPGGDIVPADIYLSGNVREKMRQARAALEAGDTAMQRNVDALAKVMPADIPYYNIEVQMGASWVPTGTYADYVAHMLNAGSAEGISVNYTAGRWRISLSQDLKARPEASAGFGTPVYSFQKLVNAAISNQTVTIRKEDADGTSYVDTEATAEVNEKIANIRTTFGDWLWADPERRVALEAEYNEVRNAYASPTFDGSFLTFEGMALSLGKGPFDLREHQANAIWRALVTRRSLNAHEVGTGKTFTMGGIAVESRRYGLAKKPLILAHNANSASVAAEIQQMYPAAKVLYIDNLAPAQIDIKMRQIANDDWDAVVVPHSLISRFALTEETLMALAAEEIAAIEAEAYAAAEEDGGTLTQAMLDDEEQLKKLRSPTAKDLVKMRNRIIETIKKQGQRASKEGAVSFEELGIDMVLVDEVHEFKKPPFSTRMRIKGLNTQSSDKSIALSFLLRYTRSRQNGGNVHLFTGTPVTNTLTEVFHAMRYIMAEEMGEADLDQWDGWFGSFAREVQDVELNAAAEYEAVNRLAGFINVPELRRMIGQYMDVVFADDMPEMQPRPTKSGKLLTDPSLTEKERAELLNGRTEDAKDRPYKKVIVETADLTPAQQRAFSEIQADAQRWRNMSGKEKKEVMQRGGRESPIIVEGRAAKASFDVRLMDGEALAGQEGRAEDDPNSKASRVVRNVTEIYRSHRLATQVIFTNAGLSTTGTRSVGAPGDKRQERFKVFSTVGDIVERLVQQGIPRGQIAVVDGATSKEKRKEIADAMNRAEIRVVIGSTQSLGVGVNMQRNLRAMHHMDAPWMPGDLEQRNGRGQRQGNQWNTVLEYRYLTDRIDGRRWQVLAIKQRFINAFLKADDTTRVIEGDAASDEESDILTTFAEAAGDPRVLIRAKLRKKIEQLSNRRRLHDAGVVDARRTAARLEKQALEKRAQRADLAPVAEKASALSSQMAGDGFVMTVDGKRYDKRGDAREAIDALGERAQFHAGMEPFTVGEFGGYPLRMQWARHSDSPALGVVIDGEVIAGHLGSVASLESRLRGYANDIAALEPQAAELERSIARLKAQAAEPFHLARELERAEADLAALETDLATNPVPPPAWLRTGAPIDTEVVWKGETKVVTGHRWNAEGWFVLAAGEDGPVAMPYLEVKDPQGMAVYEPRAFSAPEVLEKVPAGQQAAEGKGDEDGVSERRASFAPTGAAFRRWFGKSKVVDGDGNPLVVHHGTYTQFDTFDPKAMPVTEGGIVLKDAGVSAFFFTDSPTVARDFAGDDGAVMDVYLSLQNPLEIDAGGRPWLDFDEEIIKAAKEGRHDGAILRNLEDASSGDLEGDAAISTVYVAFAPNQIKSVDNAGAFDPSRPGIRESRARTAGTVLTPGALRLALARGGLGSLVGALERTGKLKVVTSEDIDPGMEGVQGWTDPDGTITLVADQIEGDPVAVLLHEAFHSGASALLGSRQWRDLMIRLQGLYSQFEQSKGRARDFFDAARERVRQAEESGDRLTEPLRVEEFAAYAIEEHAAAPAVIGKWVEDLLGAIKAWVLRRFGRQIGQVTPAELAAIARQALTASFQGAEGTAMASRRKSVAATGLISGARLDKGAIMDAIAGKLTDFKPAMLAAIPLNYFAELKRPGMVAVDQYLKVKRQMDAYRGEKHAKVDEVAQAWQKYAGIGFGNGKAEGKTRAAELSELMHDSTLAGIDPSLTNDETKAKGGYAALRSRFLAMPRAGQELFEKVRDTYAEQADELDGILLDNVRKTQEVAFRRAEEKYRAKLEEIEASGLKGLDKSKAEAEAQKVYSSEMGKATYNMKARMTKLRIAFEKNRVPAPYFPLARFGKYFVSVRDLDGTILSFSKRETEAERRQLEREMRKAFPNARIESGLMPDKDSGRDRMDPRIVADIEAILGDAKVDSAVMDAIWQRYLETLPDLSARKRFIHRKGIAGFDGDALRTFASNQFHAAHQMARLKFGIDLTELSNQAVDQAKKADDPVRAMQLANELGKRHDWVMNPTGSRAVQAVTSAMFTWYLAASPAAAIVNMTQTPMMGIPVLGARLGGVGKAAAALGKASADVIRGKGSARNARLSDEDHRALEAFYESGMIERTQAHDLAGVGEVGVAYSPLRHKIMAVISWAYHNVEVWNREVTALAAYRLAREQGLTPGKAIDLAHELTWKAHFDYSNASRPRMMQGDVQKIAFVFQSHQVNMWYRLFRDIHQAVKGESPQARREARYQLAGILGMMGLFSGVTGLFGYNVLMALLGLAFDDDDDPRSFKEEMEGHVVDLLGKDLGGMVLKGVPGHLTGMDLTSRLGMPDFFVRAPDSGAEGREWFQELIINAFGVVPSTMLNAVDGAGLVMEGKVARGLEVMAPKGLKDLMQSWRYANEGVLNRRGDAVLERDQLTPLDWLIEAAGFTPAKIAETYERMGTLKGAEQRVLDERRELMNRFALAVITGDDAARRRAIEAIKVWNRKPYARAVPITADTMAQSLKTRARNSAKREDGVLISDPELSRYLRDLMPERAH